MNEAGSPSTGIAHWFAERRFASGQVLLIVGAILGGLTGWMLYASGPWTSRVTEELPANVPLRLTGIYLALVALTLIFGGGWQIFSDTAEDRKPLAARVLLLTFSAIFGAGLFVLGLALLYVWGDTLTNLLRDGEREGAWRVLLGLAAIVGGLFIMFAGLQSVRADERRIIGIRRYIYGFNAFLTAFLLLAVLTVFNVLWYLKVPASIDATQSRLFTLSDRTKQVLSELTEPVTVYLIMDSRRAAYHDMQNLLTRCQEVTPKLTFENVASFEKQRIEDLVKRFPRISDEPQGMLIVVNNDSDRSAYVPMTQLTSRDMNPMGGGGGTERFLGEQKLINELTFLLSGKQKPVIAVMQGFGEPDLNDQTGRGGLGKLREKLQIRNFDVQPLKLDIISPQIPENTNVIVIAGPKQTYPATVADALKKFVDAGGKLFVLVDVVPVARTETSLPSTGLEQLMTAHGIDITKDAIFCVLGIENQGLMPTDRIFVQVSANAMNQPIVAPFKNDQLSFFSCRLVRPLPDVNNPSIRTQVLLQTMEGLPVWTESNPQIEPRQTFNLMAKDINERKKRLTENLPLMLAVTETPRPLPGGPPPTEKPKMVVFGDSTFVTNLRAESVEFDLFISSLEWLRERPANIGIEAKEYQYYRLDGSVLPNLNRVVYLPLLFACIIVLGLGVGVWLVRRQ